jgi:glycosyltransferase involved in cell wall biosynthesis
VLFTANNPTYLAEALLKLLRDSDQRQRLGQQGRQAVNAKFTADVMAQATLAVLENARRT